MFVVSSASAGDRQSLPLFYCVSSARQSGKRGSPNVTKNPTQSSEINSIELRVAMKPPEQADWLEASAVLTHHDASVV
jgi:hypothetical protein